VANGAGGGTSLSENLREVARELRAPLVVLTVDWSQTGTVHDDQRDQKAHSVAAGRTAMRAQWLKMHCPHSPIVFVGYSAGTQVATSAAEIMPPGSVDRVVLLGSSMSAVYDLRAALRGSCGGIDSFYSRQDQTLDMAEDNFGTTDGLKAPMAGRIGFRDPAGGVCGDYCNLRQYGWRAQMGGDGDHYYWASTHFMRRCLVPLLSTVSCASVVSVEPARTAEPPMAGKEKKK
jgi:pimeloyl-ACP methyl ester carboxylesterase